MGDTLKGQVAIVTGASGGLGAHFARVLAAEGAAVAVTARRLDKVEAIAGELAGAGHRAMALRLDVADAASIQPAFTEIEAALGELGAVDHILVDVHAEATSEKVAMGWHLDGRVTAVVGTHTHVPTADARVLPGGTAYITDVGMTGPRGGVIGVKREQAIESLLTQMPVRFETSEEDPWLMGVVISCSQPLRADSIEQVLMAQPSAASRDR